MNLRSLSDDALWQRTEALAAEERRVTLAVLYHLREIERRMLYAARGFSSLKDYCTQVLKYSESSAYRRIASMRLLREVPELDEKFKSGELTLSNAAQAQTHFHKVKKQSKKAPSVEEKRELLSKIESLSSRGCERLLGELRGETAPAERSRPINATETQYSFTVDRETEELLQEIQRELHRTLSMRELVKEMAEITLKSLQEKKVRSEKRASRLQMNAFEKKHVRNASVADGKLNMPLSNGTANTITTEDPLDTLTQKSDQSSSTASATIKASRDATPTQESFTQPSHRPESISPAKNHIGDHLESNTPAISRTVNRLGSNATAKNHKAVKASEAHSRQHGDNRPCRTRYISVSAEREVWDRAGARCQYVDSKTKRRCEGTRHLQVEHIKPHALAGTSEPENLELLCPTHNRWRAVQTFGGKKMRVFIASLR